MRMRGRRERRTIISSVETKAKREANTKSKDTSEENFLEEDQHTSTTISLRFFNRKRQSIDQFTKRRTDRFDRVEEVEDADAIDDALN